MQNPIRRVFLSQAHKLIWRFNSALPLWKSRFIYRYPFWGIVSSFYKWYKQFRCRFSLDAMWEEVSGWISRSSCLPCRCPSSFFSGVAITGFSPMSGLFLLFLRLFLVPQLFNKQTYLFRPGVRQRISYCFKISSGMGSIDISLDD